jgi:PhzF family phenazine biosynthesis protein
VVIAEVAVEALAGAAPDIEQFRRAAGGDGKFLLYLYGFANGRIRARMFAPLAGIMEDPATGGAAAPLAALLLSLNDAASGAWDITQGVEMGPSQHLAHHRHPHGRRHPRHRRRRLRAGAERRGVGVRGLSCIPPFERL